MGAEFEQLSAVERRRVRRAERRSVLVAGVGFTAVIAALTITHYGGPWHWTTPGGATPWTSLVVTVGVIVIFVTVLVPITRGQLESPGPRRDLVVSGDLRDIVRVARDLGSGRTLDTPSRPVGRALLALTGRWLVWCSSVLALAVVLGVGEVVVLPQVSGVDVAMLALLVLGSLATLVWAVSARRHGSAQGLRRS